MRGFGNQYKNELRQMVLKRGINVKLECEVKMVQNIYVLTHVVYKS